jgi:hypothetical protein
VGLTSAAYAQAQAPAPAPLVVERIHNGFVMAPDFKVTDVDGEFGQLAGVYAGSVLDERVLVGAAVYWTANGSDTFKLTYGGLLVGWRTPDTNRIRFGVRGLAGIGTATLPVEAVPALSRSPLASPTVRFGTRTPPRVAPDLALPPSLRFGAKDDFLVFEPQGTVGLNVTDHIVISVGAGYRAVALTDALRNRVDGATGSIGLEFGW